MLFKDRVKETTTTTGTGNLTTAGAATGFITFNTAFGTGSSNTFQYVIDSPTGSEWEVGVGYMSASTTLVRSTVLASSNSGSAVNFSAGTKYIRGTVAAVTMPVTAVLQSDLSKTNSTFENVTNLTLNLAAGRWYLVTLEGFILSGLAVGGVIDLSGGSVTATAVRGSYRVASVEGGYDSSIGAFASLATTASTSAEESVISISTIIHVNAAGTLIPRFKQVSTNATATVLGKYSYLTIKDITP